MIKKQKERYTLFLVTSDDNIQAEGLRCLFRFVGALIFLNIFAVLGEEIIVICILLSFIYNNNISSLANVAHSFYPTLYRLVCPPPTRG